MVKESLRQQTKKGLYWRFTDQFAGYGMQFLVGIVMARLLSPSDYGITALPAVFIAVAHTFQTCGFGAALIRKKDLSEKDLSTAFYYSIAVGISSYLVLFIAAPWIADFYKTPVLTSLIRVTALSFLWGPLSTPQSVLMNRKLDFKTPTKIHVVCKIFSGIVGIAMAYMGYGLWSLVVTGVLTSILGTILNWFAIKWIPKTGFSKESFKYLWGFGNKIMLSALLNNFYSSITPLFVGKVYSPAELGIYNRAAGYANLPSKNVSVTLESVTYPVLSKMQDDDERLANNYRKMLKVSAFVVFPLMMLLSALARPLVIVMITAKWEACIILLQIICFDVMWYPIHAINLNLLKVKGRTDLFFRLEIIKKIVGLLMLIITLPMGLVALCIGRVCFSLLSLAVNTYYTGKLIKIGFWKQIGDISPTLLLGSAMFIAVQSFLFIIDNMWIQIIGGGIIGAVIYLGVSYLMKFEELKEVFFLLKKK